ncbi:hypothetical protein [Brachybacterium paraconglomeratum]|uniref:hypothetical protein n=1 Tax=Brachybacterium paraconglomeratum TaxID=173362 RepID=UPI0022E51C5D|nr:hypothetical protein [Brachybacterium paraconglomeratum]
MKATHHGVWDFSETEWAAIDKAVRNVYFKKRTRLPAHWQGGPTDPAGELRSWAYEYAATHAQEIHERDDWQITHLLGDRAQQLLNRSITKYEELPYSVGYDFNERVTKAVGGPWEAVRRPSKRNPYAEVLEPYKRLLTPRRRRILWERLNPGDSTATNYLDPTGDAAAENILLEQLQRILDTELFHPGDHCKCEECVNIIKLAA